MSNVILITGASRGVGHAIAKILIAAPDQHKLVLASRTSAPLEALANTAPGRVTYHSGDLADPSTIKAAVSLAITKFGRLDGLILNHGTLGTVARIVDLELTDWQDTFNTNFMSTAMAAKFAIPELRRTKGRLIITSSGAATGGTTGWGVYGATKAAQNHLALTLKVEEPEIVTVAVRPGMVDTEMQRDIREKHAAGMDEEQRKRFIKAYEEGKLVRPEECGHVIAMLAVGAGQELSGRFLSWNDDELKQFQARD